MNPASVTKVQLSQIASQQGDAITFDVSSIQTLAPLNEIFLIFYLSKEDEFNGYGTVIQLDPQTKQASIYADLNPEYTYLFYKNDQGQLQSLLWCIEIASRTTDGLFIAHLKSYGRGISEEDLQRFSQVNLPQNQPETKRQLSEAYTPQPASTSQTQPTQPPPGRPAQTPGQQAASSSVPGAPNPPRPQPTSSQMSNQPAPARPTPPSTPTSPPQPQPPAPAPSENVGQQPSMSQPPNPAPTPQPPSDGSLSFVNGPEEQAANDDEQLRLPPLPHVPSKAAEPVGQAAPVAETPPTPQPAPPPIPQPANPPAAEAPKPPSPEGSPLPAGIPDIFASMPPAGSPAVQQSAPASARQKGQPTPKQPVGRPPKPLLSDQLWPVSPQDFTWAKTVSRQPIGEFRETLQQKVLQQIRTNKPGLIEDWEFNGEFEKVFSALCTTYEIIPSLRHDILKSLLNGRVAESIQRNRQSR